MWRGSREHLLANPRKGAQDGNDDEDVCDDAGGNHRRGLDGVVPYDVDNLEYQPPEGPVSSTFLIRRGGAVLRSTRQCASGMDTANVL